MIGLQEAGDRGTALVRFTEAHPEWSLYRPTRPRGASSVPLLIKGDAGKGLSNVAVPRRFVGRGAGPRFSKPKAVNGWDLGNVIVLNTHLIPSWTRSEASIGRRSKRARTEHVQDHVAAIVETTQQAHKLGRVVVLTADLNGKPDEALLRPLHEVGYRGWSTVPTRGSRSIDQVLVCGPAAVTASRTVATSSDHRARVVTIEKE